MTCYPSKLKDPRTCRIFFSSPFGGMEEEREELTRKYFPQIDHLCNSRGIQFVAVDMRWGITTESAESAQVINICLGELDRSDIFVGFFGQRYGWVGADDELLQRNFDNAVGQYPWLDKVRGKSVTELEYLHGHLNNPGALPACILFRSKTYDDKQREEAERAGNKKAIFKYSPESLHSSDLMEDLKMRVQATADKTLGVHMDYKHPHDAARLMFEAIVKHLKEVLLVSTVKEDLSSRAMYLAEHDAFLASRVKIYVGGEQYLKKLDEVLHSDNKYIVVTGTVGSGKSALLCKWVNRVKETEDMPILVYHFIGCANATGSDVPFNLLRRLTKEINYALNEPEESDLENEISETKLEWKITVNFAIDKFTKSLNKASEQGKRVVIVLDGLNNIQEGRKTFMPLYWLNETFPTGVSIVASINSDNNILEELLEKRGFEELKIQPLDKAAKLEIAVKTLHEVSKELSKHQLDKVINDEQTSNPLFLKIVMSELAMFGYFRLLDKKIDSLLAAKNVQELFQKFLERLEQDYNVTEYPHNLVKQVFVALCTSHEGLTEIEITESFQIPIRIWAPLNFAMKKFIIKHSGMLTFAFNELRQAVKDRYLKTDEDRIEIVRSLIKYFDNKRKELKKWMYGTEPPIRRPAFELPWLQKDINDIDGLITTLTDLHIFKRLKNDAVFELLELWKFTELGFLEIANLYIKSFDQAVSDVYCEQQDMMSPPGKNTPGFMLHKILEDISILIEVTNCSPAHERIILRMISLLKNCECDFENNVFEKEVSVWEYYLACCYADSGRYEEAEALNFKVKDYLEVRLNRDGQSREIETQLARLYSGIGIVYYYQMDSMKAMPWLEKSLEIHKRLGNLENQADSLTTIGTCYLDLGDPEKALSVIEEAIKLYEVVFFGCRHNVIGNALTNAGLCYRRLGRHEEAEATYKKSLEIKVSAVGWDHPTTAMALMNLGTLENIRQNFTKAEEYYQQACEIYKKSNFPDDDFTYRQVQENLVNTMIILEKYEEVLPMFWTVFNTLTKLDLMDHCIPGIYDKMAAYFNNHKQYEDCERVLLALIKSKQKTCLTYMILDHLDSLKPKEERTERPYEMTLDYALSQWPGNDTIVYRKATFYLIPQEDVDGLTQLLDNMDKNSQYGSDIYDLGASWCEKENKPKMAIDVLKFGIDKYPDTVGLKTKLLDLLRGQKMYRDALLLAKELVTVLPDKMAVFLVGAETATYCDELELAKEWLMKVIESEDANFAEKAKNALIFVESRLSEDKENNDQK